jgi:maltose phosphorylase
LTGEYGYYGVMGVDEFHMMVNNNCFTNYLAKKAMSFTVDVINAMKLSCVTELKSLMINMNFTQDEVEQFKYIADNMCVLQKENGIYEQHDGFFALPHIDVNSIPIEEFPLYNHWSYDRIYRTDMIKQADVLMMLFMYSGDFSNEIKLINYDYYEPRCIHESSLSPSVHSIVAAEVGKHKEAYEFFRFATRLDLDNYNRNTKEGLHMTSIAAAWMNIVYGFGGMRTDGEMLSFNPTIPSEWQSFRFFLTYQQELLQIEVNQEKVCFQVAGEKNLSLCIYGNRYLVDKNGICINIPEEYLANK